MTRRFAAISLLIVLAACADGPTETTIPLAPEPGPLLSSHATTIEVEVVSVDARLYGTQDGPALSANILESGVEYLITVDGNWSAWPQDWWVCTSLYPTKHMSPSVPAGASAGFNAEWQYAHPNLCGWTPVRREGISFSLDAGATFFNPTPIDGAFNTDHIYEYVVTGAGQRAAFRVPDTNRDNHGVLIVTIEEIVPAPVDDTPPAITPSVSGTLGDDAWYTSDVTVSWDVTDPESDVTSTDGCDAETVSEDTDGITFTCTATSAGGTASESVTIKRDATPPVIAFSGNGGAYTVDQTVDITCAASDATSGLAASDCPGADGDAYTFGVGTTTLLASATDNAGNGSAASAEFDVSVTTESLCILVQRWVTQGGVANALCQQLTQGRNGVRSFINTVNAQTGRHVPAAYAPILIALAEAL